MIDWLHQLTRRNPYANYGNTASVQSDTLLMSTGSEQQPMDYPVLHRFSAKDGLNQGGVFCSDHSVTLPKAEEVCSSYSGTTEQIVE